jgi:hypothetical protein
MMKHLPIAAATVALSCILLPQPAFAVEHDGQLPLYPYGVAARGMGDIPQNALAQGVPYQQTTTDSIHIVDLWYRSNAPKSCSRIEASAGVQYKCPAGSIVIQNHGGTIISYVPAFPHF